MQPQTHGDFCMVARSIGANRETGKTALFLTATALVFGIAGFAGLFLI